MHGASLHLCAWGAVIVLHEMGLCEAGGSGWNTGSSAKQKYGYSDRISDKLCDYYLILCVFAAVVPLYVQYIFHH